MTTPDIDALTKRAERAEAKMREFAELADKRFQQWEDCKVVSERRRRMRSEALDRAKVYRKRAEAAEAEVKRLKESARRHTFNELLDLNPECPRCFENVAHEDDHLVGDKGSNCWYECPADDRPTH